MRSLSAAGGRVIATLLAEVPGDESDRIRVSGVPRTTYQAIRRRAFLSGWLYERYVPSPKAVGASGVSISLAQPFSERWAGVVRSWRATPETVVLFASAETLLRVSYDYQPAGGGRGGAPQPDDDWFRRSWTIRVPGVGSSVPVFFDFEGAWARRVGSRTTVSYPQGLPESIPTTAGPNRLELADLLLRPFSTLGSDSPIVRLSGVYLARRQRRLLERGFAAHRVFPSLSDLPPYRGGRAERVVFLSGLLRDGETLERLRGRLDAGRPVAPFLAAEGGGRVLFGMLAPSPAREPSAAPPLLRVFEEALREIEIVREPVDTLFPVVDHRYDRLVELMPQDGSQS